MPCPDDQPYPTDATHSTRVDMVVKLGGGVLAHLEAFAAALAAIARAAARRRLVVVPGGGPFADAVRAAARRLSFSDDAAHWMAILGMDQYAHLIGAQLPRSMVVEGPAQITAALGMQCVPVLAPYRWLRAADPLPHSWDVTSDSIAAWICADMGARDLVLVKPPGALVQRSASLVDNYFDHVPAEGINVTLVAANHWNRLDAALGGTIAGSTEREVVTRADSAPAIDT
jgi:5-(aminomethyl)-3-furanmethanol phosphate kinase